MLVKFCVGLSAPAAASVLATNWGKWGNYYQASNRIILWRPIMSYLTGFSSHTGGYVRQTLFGKLNWDGPEDPD